MAFKAKLIESDQFFKRRNRHFWLTFVGAIPIGVSFGYFNLNLNLFLIVLVIYFTLLFLLARNQKIMNSLIGSRLLELNQEGIFIKSAKGKVLELIPLEKITTIEALKEYQLYQQSTKAMVNEIVGNPERSVLNVVIGNVERNFLFDIDSHYMVKQLEKTLAAWEKSGIKINRV
jgi:hypothetical protein